MLEALLLLQAVPPFDWSGFQLKLIEALVPIVTTLVIWAARALLEKTPRMLIPIIAVLLGTGLDALTGYISGGTFNPVIGGLLGAAAVWIHQFISVWAEFGMQSRAESQTKKPAGNY